MKKYLIKILCLMVTAAILSSTLICSAQNQLNISQETYTIMGKTVENNVDSDCCLPDAELKEYRGTSNSEFTINEIVVNINFVKLVGKISTPDGAEKIELLGEILKWEDKALFLKLEDAKNVWEVVNCVIYFNLDKSILFDDNIKDDAGENVFSLCLKRVGSKTYSVFETSDIAWAERININKAVYNEVDSKDILWFAKYINSEQKAFQIEENVYKDIRYSSRATLDQVQQIRTYSLSYVFNSNYWEETTVVVFIVEAPLHLQYCQDANAYMVIDSTELTCNGEFYSWDCPSLEIGHGPASGTSSGTMIEAILYDSDHCFSRLQINGVGTQVSSGNITVGIAYSLPYTLLNFTLQYDQTCTISLNSYMTNFANYTINGVEKHCHTADAIYKNNMFLSDNGDMYVAMYKLVDYSPQVSTDSYLWCKFTFEVYDAYRYEKLGTTQYVSIMNGYDE